VKRILLTGGTGYIGTHTAVALAQTGYEVVLYDNLCNSELSVLDNLNKITGKQFPFIEGDVRNAEMLGKTLIDYKIDAVMHFAGLKAVSESVEKPIKYYDNNVNGALSLLKAMCTANTKTLVFSSSATVYGEPDYLPFDENHPTRAVNPYGRCKLHVEEMLSDMADADPNWRISILRYFNPVGAHESGLIGENPKGTPNNLMPYIAQVAIGKRDALNVFGNDYPTKDGTGVRDYIHVMDLAEGHLVAMEYLASHTSCHVFNLGAGRGYSVLDMVKAFETSTGKSVPIRIAPRRLGDIPEFFADATKAQQVLNWKAERTLIEMCNSSWVYQSKNNENI